MPWISEASPLETYNSLADRHLVHFFRSARMRRHLIKTGLVTEDGEIRPESEYREIRNREDQKRALLEIIAHAIVERSLEAERIRQGNIRKTLEDICKLHRVKRIREERQKRAEENILMQLIPRDHVQPENLQPISRSPHEGDSMKGRDLVVAVSDIDEPELAVMDKRSQVEVVKAQRIRRQRKSRERNAGQPPYLYLWEPGINRRNPGSGHRLKDDERGRSKIRGDERSEPGPFLRSQQSGSREGRFSRSGPNGKDDTNTKLEKSKRKKASGFGDRLVYDDPQSPCIVRFMYLGSSKNDELQLKKSSGREDSRLPQAFRTRIFDGDTKAARFITVIQQPSGGNTVTVFKGYLQPGDEFEFTSRRTYGYPFSLSLCIDGTQDARVSTCCEYRHRRGARIGGQAGHFVYLAVEGSIPCFKCQAARSLRHERQKQSKKKQTKHKEVDNEVYQEDFEESPENHVESSEESECEHEPQCTEQTKDMNDSGMIIFQSVHSSSCSSASKEDIEIPETVQSVSRSVTAKSASICTTKSGKLASLVRSTIRPLVVLHASLAGRVKCVIWMQLQLKTEALFAKHEEEIDEQKQDDISMHCQGTVYQHGSPNIQFLLPKTHLSNRYEIRWPLNDLEITDELDRMEFRNLARVLPIPMQNVESIKLWLEIPHKDIYYLFEEYSFDAVQSTCVFQKPLKKPLRSDYSSSDNTPSSCGTPREPVIMSRPQSQQSFCTETHSNKSPPSLVLASLEPNLHEPQIESLRPQQPALGRQDSDSTFVSTVSFELDSVLKMDESSKENQRGLSSKLSNEEINIEEASFNKMKHPARQISDGIASSDSTLEGKLAHSKSASDVNKNGESSSARGHTNRNSGYDCNPSDGPSFTEQPRAESTTGISKHPKFSM